MNFYLWEFYQLKFFKVCTKKCISSEKSYFCCYWELEHCQLCPLQLIVGLRVSGTEGTTDVCLKHIWGIWGGRFSIVKVSSQGPVRFWPLAVSWHSVCFKHAGMHGSHHAQHHSLVWIHFLASLLAPLSPSLSSKTKNQIYACAV